MCTGKKKVCVLCLCYTVATKMSLLAFPTQPFLPAVKRETLETKDVPPNWTASTHTHPAVYSTPSPQQEAPNRLVTCSSAEASKLPVSSDGGIKDTQEFSTRLFSPLSPQQAVFLFFFLLLFYCYQCCRLFPHLQYEKKINKWTLDGLLKMCNIKAKQMCICYLC